MYHDCLRHGGQAGAALLLFSMVVFGLAQGTDDPTPRVRLPSATPAASPQAEQPLRLAQPALLGYWRFLRQAVQGDFGTSLRVRRPVRDLVAERLPHSLRLLGAALLCGLLLALPLSLLAAMYPGTPCDTLAHRLSALGQALPAFWVGMVLIEFGAAQWQLLPAGGVGSLAHYVLPALAIGWGVSAALLQQWRARMLEMSARTACPLAIVPSRGARWQHGAQALRQVVLSAEAWSALSVSTLVTTTLGVEIVFAWPGLGRLTYDALASRDVPVIQAVVLLLALLVVVVHLGRALLSATLASRRRGDAAWPLS